MDEKERQYIDWLYEHGKMPARYYYQLVNDPVRAYEDQRRQILERITEQNKEPLETIIQQIVDELVDNVRI